MSSAFDKYDREHGSTSSSSHNDNEKESPKTFGQKIARLIDQRTHIVSPVFLVVAAIFVVLTGAWAAALQQWWWYGCFFLFVVLAIYPVMYVEARINWNHEMARGKKERKEVAAPVFHAPQPSPWLALALLTSGANFGLGALGHVIGPLMIWLIPAAGNLAAQALLAIPSIAPIATLFVLASRGQKDARPWHVACLIIGIIASLATALFMGILSYSGYMEVVNAADH